MSKLAEVKGRLFPKGIRRKVENLRRQVLSRVTGQALRRDLARLGVARGDLLCVHSKLSALGHVVGGPETVLAALRDLVGPEGTLMMPTFCGGNSTYAYVQSNPPPFDPQRTPCTTGALCELFRVQPGVVRSLHPTHSVAAQGPLADELTRGHDESPTPFGPNTPFARLADLGGSILLLGVNANSIIHYVEEQVDWPNRWADHRFPLAVATPTGLRVLSTPVHRPGPYSHVIFPGIEPGTVRLLHLPTYALHFCVPQREREEMERLRPDTRVHVLGRRDRLLACGAVQFGDVGAAQTARLEAREFCAQLETELKAHLSQHRDLYRPEILEAAVTHP